VLLTKACVQNFKSINHSGEVTIDSGVTVLVGQNESGKTAFLQALTKARSAVEGIEYDVTEDYPRKNVNEYRRRHQKSPDIVASLTYELEQADIDRINNAIEFKLLESLTVKLTHHYQNAFLIEMSIPEEAYIHHLVKALNFSTDVTNTAKSSKTIRELLENIEKSALTDAEKPILEALKQRFKPAERKWPNLLSQEIWTEHIDELIPKFFYFDDYYLLPGKVNLHSLVHRLGQNQLTEEDKTVVSLLKMADVDPKDLSDARSYEEIKSRLEGLSNSITDRIFSFWKQNKELHVEFDIRADSTERAPFNSGSNLYIRIRNQRHRVTVPFNQRSKGFIWFFSFIVWFDTVKERLKEHEDLALLLDEPGLSLHALAQEDFLGYIDTLAEHHQILYTTHSPFMIHSDRLHQVRLVEDKVDEGTVVTDNVMGSDPKTVFPLQAALGYTIAQNLFISKRNLLVEGPADLVYLKYFSNVLDSGGRTGLSDEITIVPAGGLDKVATFIALLGANALQLGVLHDYKGAPEQRIEELVQQKIIHAKQVLNFGMFRDPTTDSKPKGKKAAATSPNQIHTDIEDLITVPLYLTLFNGAFKKQLGSTIVKDSELPPGTRILDRLERYLTANSITLRKSGGFNHYAVANYLVSNPPNSVDDETLRRFEAIFQAVNEIYKD
jgi:predicted ATP-dependent endonuclease of OLD family